MIVERSKRISKQIIQKEEGFVFAVTAMIVVIVLSLILVYLRSTLLLNLSESSEIMSTSQSYWSAVSGMEYAYEESVTNADSVPGTYSYYNSTITLESSLTDNGGGPLTTGSLRFISTGNHGDTKRIVESSFQGIYDYDLWPPISVILEGGSEECGECEGKVTQLTLQYNGNNSAMIKVKQKNGNIVFNQTVSAGGTFTINGTANHGTFGNRISLYVNNRLDAKIHTSCSQPIGAGMVAGSFEIISGYSRQGGLLCDFGSNGDCGECDGKVTQLTLQYNGTRSARIKVKQKNGDTVFNQTVSAGGTFTINGTDKKGTLGTEISLYVNNRLDVKIHTSCSEPIGGGLVAGSFEIISGYSRNGGLLCDLDGGNGDCGEECGECDGKVTQLTLQYNGNHSASIKVKQRKGRKWKEIFNQTVTSGGTFTIYGTDNNGTLGNVISLYVNNRLDTKIHTSCSEPIGGGLVAGSFVVISGYSRNGGLLCDLNGGSGSSEFEIKNNAILNCSIFIGGDVDVEPSATVGSPVYGGPTTIYVPSGNTVTGNFNSTFDWDIYPDPTPVLPNFNHSPYDSLISIAEAITGTGGNKYKGDLEIKLTTFDLSLYSNQTYFVNGDIKIKGSIITVGTGGDSLAVSPGILVSSGKIIIEKEHNTQSFIEDNVILIANKKIEVKDVTHIGSDLSGNPPSCRPSNFNEVYAKNDIIISENVVVWAVVTARGDLKLDGTLYGVAFVPNGKFVMDDNNAYMEGAIFVKKMVINESDDHDHHDDDDGDCITDGFNKGRMKLTHCFPQPYFSSRKFVPVMSSFKEI